MDFLYCFANASLTLRVIEHIKASCPLPVEFVTVVHQIDGWLVRIKVGSSAIQRDHLDLQAFLMEMGIPYQPNRQMQAALWNLELGEALVDVMRRYRVAVVSHGRPDRVEIEEFRRQFISGLGYCPATLA